MMKKTLLTGALVALIGAGVLLSIRASRTEFVQEVATAPVYADEQEVAQEPKPEPKTAKKAPKAVTWQDNPNQCTEDQWIDEQAPYTCIDKAVDQVTSVARSEVTPSPTETSTANVGSIEKIVRDAATKYGLDPDYLVYIANCESTLNPNVVNYDYYENGHPSGLFQHLSGYWPARATAHGYPGASVFDAEANANVTASMFASGSAYLWDCR